MQGNARNTEPQHQPRPALRGIWWIAALILGLGLAVYPFDFFLADSDNLEYMPGDLKRFVDLSETFAHGFGVFIVAVGIWVLASQNKRFIPRVVACAFWPAMGVHLFKSMFARFRPIVYMEDGSMAGKPPEHINETWLGWLPNSSLNTVYATQSFPSAHAATVWGLAIGMAWLFPQGRWFFFGIAILASIQRVTSFAHWPSDVFFGAAIAFVMAGSLTQNWGMGYLLGRFESRNELKLLTVEDEISDRRAA